MPEWSFGCSAHTRPTRAPVSYLRECMLICTWTVAHQVPLSMGLSRQEYYSGLPFLLPGDLHDPRLEPSSLASPALAGRFCIIVAPGKPSLCYRNHDLLANIWPAWHSHDRDQGQVQVLAQCYLTRILRSSLGECLHACKHAHVHIHVYTFMYLFQIILLYVNLKNQHKGKYVKYISDTGLPYLPFWENNLTIHVCVQFMGLQKSQTWPSNWIITIHTHWQIIMVIISAKERQFIKLKFHVIILIIRFCLNYETNVNILLFQ